MVLAGGSWTWLNFMGDWSANEHLNSLTGENLGFRLQGWDAALFGLVYYGLSPDLK